MLANGLRAIERHSDLVIRSGLLGYTQGEVEQEDIEDAIMEHILMLRQLIDVLTSPEAARVVAKALVEIVAMYRVIFPQLSDRLESFFVNALTG